MTQQTGFDDRDMSLILRDLAEQLGLKDGGDATQSFYGNTLVWKIIDMTAFRVLGSSVVVLSFCDSVIHFVFFDFP